MARVEEDDDAEWGAWVGRAMCSGGGQTSKGGGAVTWGEQGRSERRGRYSDDGVVYKRRFYLVILTLCTMMVMMHQGKSMSIEGK